MRANIESYVKGFDIYWAKKVVGHKLYGNLLSLSIQTYWSKVLSLNYITGLPISTNWKGEIYDLILVIISQILKLLPYELFNVNFNVISCAKIIIKVVVEHHGISD